MMAGYNSNNSNMNGVGNMNKMNSGRDMSPNKIVAKSKPLVSNNNINNINQLQLFQQHNHQQQLSYGYTSNNNGSKITNNNNNKRITNNNNNSNLLNNIINTNNFSNNISNNNIKSPRSPQYDTNTNSNKHQHQQLCANHVNKKA